MQVLARHLFKQELASVTCGYLKELASRFGKKFLLRHFFGQVLNRKNPSFIRASLLSKECFISPRFCLLEFKVTSNLEKYFSGFIHV
jgi:hypothetical protein